MTQSILVGHIFDALRCRRAEYASFRRAVCDITMDCDHKSAEMILTDRDGADWVLTLKPLPQESP